MLPPVLADRGGRVLVAGIRAAGDAAVTPVTCDDVTGVTCDIVTPVTCDVVTPVTCDDVTPVTCDDVTPVTVMMSHL